VIARSSSCCQGEPNCLHVVLCPSRRSPKITYSDRFIPSRAASSRLDYSILDREAAASETPRCVRASVHGMLGSVASAATVGWRRLPFMMQAERCATERQSERSTQHTPQHLPSFSSPAPLPPNRRAAEKEESSGAYNMLLRSELLGCPAAPASPEKCGTGAGSGMPSTSGAALLGSPTKRCVGGWVAGLLAVGRM